MKNICLTIALVGAVALSSTAARADTMSNEELLVKLRVLMKDKTAKQSLEKIVCDHDIACRSAISKTAATSQARAVPAAQGNGGAKNSSPDYSVHHTILLRDVYSPVAFMTDDSKVSQRGATFSITDSHQDRKTTFIGKGALMLAAYGYVDTNSSALPIGYFALTPGVEWDRKVINGVDTGTVSARFGGEVALTTGTFDHYLRSAAVYTTDVKSRANLFGVENSWQPVQSDLWWNVRKRMWLDAPVWFGFYPAINGNLYRSKAIGDLATLKPNHNYFWTGPSVAASIDFDKETTFENLSFYAKYFYLYEVYEPRNSTVNYLEAGLQYHLVKLPATAFANGGDITFDVHYASGRAPQTLDRKAEWFAGLNLKLGDITRN